MFTRGYRCPTADQQVICVVLRTSYTEIVETRPPVVVRGRRPGRPVRRLLSVEYLSAIPVTAIRRVTLPQPVTSQSVGMASSLTASATYRAPTPSDQDVSDWSNDDVAQSVEGPWIHGGPPFADRSTATSPTTSAVLPEVIDESQRPPWPASAEDISDAVNCDPDRPAAAIVAGLVQRFMLPPSEIPRLSWAVEAAVCTQRHMAHRLVIGARQTLLLDPSGASLVPVASAFLSRMAARPF